MYHLDIELLDEQQLSYDECYNDAECFNPYSLKPGQNTVKSAVKENDDDANKMMTSEE